MDFAVQCNLLSAPDFAFGSTVKEEEDVENTIPGIDVQLAGLVGLQTILLYQYKSSSDWVGGWICIVLNRFCLDSLQVVECHHYLLPLCPLLVVGMCAS